MQLPLELPRRMRVGGDRDTPSGRARGLEQGGRGMEPFWTRVDLDRDVMFAALREDGVRVELRLGSPPADDDPPGAVAEDVHVGVAYGVDHPRCHLLLRHAELRMHACNHDV